MRTSFNITTLFPNAHMARCFALAAVAVVTLGVSGCAGFRGAANTPAVVATSGVKLQGSVHGGQQPVSGATIQLYAASTGGYASAAFALLNAHVTTNATGGFVITGDYTCPSNSAQTYIVGTGGNTGGGNNANNAMMAALGDCGNLSSATFINMNELTTVASVWALAPFMSGYANVGSTSTNTTGLASAFATVNKLASISAGVSPGPALPSGATAPVAEMNTLANILAACINSAGGVAGDGSACGALFTATTPSGGPAPTDTIGAALNIAKYPSANVSTLLALSSPTAPFQPSFSAAPTDWTLSLTYTGGFNAPSAAAVDGSGNLWVANAGNDTVSLLNSAGAPVSGSPFSTAGVTLPSAIAIDSNGRAWIAGKGNSQLTALDISGAVLSGAPFSGGGLNAPTGVNIDGVGNVWVTNSGNSSVSEFSSTGAAISGAGGFTGAGITSPVAVVVDPR